MLGRFAVLGTFLVAGCGGMVMFLKLAGAIRTTELMAFAGNSGHGNGHQQQGK